MDGSTHIAPLTFGDLLRQHRQAAGLTQETLAERAGLSVRGISDLERGARTHPYRETVNMLASALGLAGAERAAFAQRARRGGRVAGGAVQSRGGDAPVPLTSLIGRSVDVAAVSALLHDDAVRLVTLSGPGGVGKTRLALAVIEAMRDVFADGALFVDLAPLRHAADVTTAIGAVLGLRERSGGSFAEQVRRAVGERPLLLLLDNFEHLLDGAPAVGELLRAAPSLKVLVTSREALRLRGERDYLVAPLALPESDHAPGPALSATAGAVQLFVERAQAVDAQFQLSTANMSAVSAICRRLDGLPLAIELAAARAKALPPPAMLPRLERQLALLTGGPRDMPERQRTMRDAIAWSYDLLSADEQALLRRLATFAGGFTLEAAEAIGGEKGEEGGRGGRFAGERTSAPPLPPLPPSGPWAAPLSPPSSPSVLDLLASLIDKSLIWRGKGASAERFAMLETIREFALERMHDDPAAAEAARRAHAAYFLGLAEEARAGLVGTDQARWLARLDRDEGNLRAALDWTIANGAAADALRFASALWRYWSPRGRLRDGRYWLERALARRDAAQAPPAIRAAAHNGLGNLLGDSGEYGQARRQFEQSRALRRAIDDLDGVAGALNNLGLIAMWLGEYDEATRLHQESLEIRRRQEDQFGEALSLSNLGDVLLARGELDAARALQTDALRLREAINDATGCAYTHYNLGEIARLQGDMGGASSELRESLRRFEELGDRLGIAYAEWSLSDVASRGGDVAKAADLLDHALETRYEIGDQRGFIEGVEMLGLIAIREGLARDGQDLLRMALAAREALASPRSPSTEVELARASDVAQERRGVHGSEPLPAVRGERAEMRRLANEVIERLLARGDGVTSPS